MHFPWRCFCYIVSLVLSPSWMVCLLHTEISLSIFVLWFRDLASFSEVLTSSFFPHSCIPSYAFLSQNSHVSFFPTCSYFLYVGRSKYRSYSTHITVNHPHLLDIIHCFVMPHLNLNILYYRKPIMLSMMLFFWLALFPHLFSSFSFHPRCGSSRSLLSFVFLLFQLLVFMCSSKILSYCSFCFSCIPFLSVWLCWLSWSFTRRSFHVTQY